MIGVGTEPAVEIMAGTGLDQGGGIPVGPSLETAVPGVFAVGDVARHDHPVFGPIRVEHYDNAVKMGEHAANAMLGVRGSLRRSALVLVRPVRLEDRDGRLRADMGPDGRPRVARGTLLLRVPVG